MTQTPATVITGFLGSGKTTIINNLILDLQKFKSEKVAYIKNEIGQEDLDAKLMVGQNIKAKEVLGGCICCTLVGPFITSINELLDTYKPDRLIVESAGTADPAALALMVEDHPRLNRDGVIGIVDVQNFSGYKNLSEVTKRQTELVDLIVFNKVEGVSKQQKQRVVGYVRELNEYSPIVEAPLGKLNLELAFGITSSELTKLLTKTHDEYSHHLEEDQINAFTFVSQKQFEPKKLVEIIKNLPKNIFRVKGVINLTTGWQILNAAYKRVDFSVLPENFKIKNNETRLIVIGFKARENKVKLETCLKAGELVC